MNASNHEHEHDHEHNDEHDQGLQHDLEVIAHRRHTRRRLLGWMLSGGVVGLAAACGGGGGLDSSTESSSDGSSSDSSDSGSCLADPEETAGPYPADGSNSTNGSVVNVLSESGIVRSNIRTSFGSSTTDAGGVTLQLTLTLVDVSGGCTPLSGYAIYLWHCNHDGEYSLYSSDVRDENYLRGVQVTDANGQVTFLTYFPACYDGRWPHMHIEIYTSESEATSYASKVATTQLCMPEDTCDEVYNGSSLYSDSVANLAKVSISSDGVFGDNSSEEITLQTPAFSGSVSAGYTATATLAI
ncbi:MAG: intradiol ring-cleavage dioxygenase [Solimonas sp.]